MKWPPTNPGRFKNGDAGNRGEQFSQKGQTLRDQFRAKESRACDISSWPREAGHKSVSDRVAHSSDYDRDRGGRLLRSTARGRSQCDDEVDLETDQFGRQTREPLDLPVRRSVLNDDVPTLDIAKFSKS